ncbi:hypothetical protein MPSEU_000618700 [Mayamaea pseudoterrestris]|nr:hypothetical protein MPSEU_000618700 [Mayamaea pseudoterrestris]
MCVVFNRPFAPRRKEGGGCRMSHVTVHVRSETRDSEFVNAQMHSPREFLNNMWSQCFVQTCGRARILRQEYSRKVCFFLDGLSLQMPFTYIPKVACTRFPEPLDVFSLACCFPVRLH